MATRLEKVVLDIESNLAPVMTRDAAAAALLKRELNSLSTNAVRGTSKDVDTLGTSMDRGGREIDRYSGRLRLLLDTAAILGPALIPIGAVGIPALTGLAAQFGAAAFAGGTAIIAFQGVGTALEAVNKAALEPTTANLEAARLAMARLGPEARSFVTELHDLIPALQGVRNAGAAGLFPGLEKSLDDMESLLPRVEDIVFRIGHTLGELAADGAESLAGPRWREFIEFVGDEVPRALTQMGRTVGDLAHGLAELWMAFDPLNDSFTAWLADAADGFDKWARGLSQTQGFQEFIDYIRENGPRVADALGSIGNALLQIIEAAAPLGGPVLGALAAVADVIAKIADSDAGPAIMATVTALALLSRGMRAWQAVSATSWATAIKGADTFTGKLAASRGVMLKSGAALAGIALASSDAAQGFGLSNTASLALLGTLGGPWGAAVGGAVGLLLDASAASGTFEVSSDELIGTLNQQTGAITANTTAWAANQLEKNGTLKAAQELGLSLEDVTQAALGDAEAMDRVTAGITAADAAIRNANGDLVVGTEVWTAFADNTYAVEKGIGGVSEGLGVAQGRFQRVTAASAQTSEGFAQVTSAAEEFAAAVERLNRLLEKRSNVRDYEAALDELTKSVKENGRNLDINTAKGRANEAALDQIAATAIKVAQNLHGMNRIRFMEQARRDFVDAAQKLGMSRVEAQALADKLGLLDRTKAKPEIDVDTANAHRQVDALQGDIDRMHGKDIFINVHTRRSNEAGGFGAVGDSSRLAPSSRLSPSGAATPVPVGRLAKVTSILDAPTLRTAVAMQTAARAAAEVEYGFDRLRDATERELNVRRRLLERELEHAQKRFDAEMEQLRELKAARRELADAAAGNFMSGLFGDIDLMSAIRDGLLPSEVMTAVREYAQQAGLGDLSTEEQVQAYLDSLSAAQLAALEGQASAGILQQDTRDAQAFADLLEQLAGMGLDGGLFQELATSGNLAAAQYYATLSPEQLDALEQMYEERNAAANAVAAAAAQDLNDEVRKQTKELQGARGELREAKQELREANHRLAEIEKNTADGPSKGAQEFGRVINGTVGTANRSA